MKKILSAALALVCIWFATPAHAALPTGYTELQYIESTGTQYINTGVIVDDMTYVFKSDFATTVHDTNVIFGTMNVSEGYPGIVVNASGSFRYGTQQIASSVDFAVGIKYSIELLYQNLKVDGTNYAASGTTDSTALTYPMFLFARNNVGTAGNFASVKMYSWQMYDTDGTTLLMNLVPAKNASGVIGMYDTVGNRFYTNAGTGEFIAGDPVTTCDGTVVSGQWNQLVQNGNFADGVNNWIVETSVVANAENGVLSVTYQNGGDRGVGQVVEIGSGHKVFVSFDVDSYTGESYIGVFRGGNSASMFRSLGDAVKINRTGHYEQVKTLTALSSGFDYYAAGAGRPVGGGVTVSFSNLNVIDLTEMFGAGNEPSTEQEAKAAIAQRANELGISATNGYYAYHANENISSCISKIKIATTKYNETAFSPLNAALQNAISVVDSVVSNTITQAGRIATLQAQKQTRPNDIADDNENCPAGKKCLLVEDASGVPHWYEIVENPWGLPDGYIPLEYLRSDGRAYINTNYSPTSKTRIEVVAKVDSGAGNVNIVGSGRGTTGGSSDALLVINSLNNSTAEIKFDQAGAWIRSDNVNMLEKNRLSLSATKFSVNGDVKETNDTTIPDTDNRPFYIFQRWRPLIESTNNKVQIYEFSIYENDILVRNMIPVKRNSDGVLGMFDTVNDVFYTNAGDGEFVAGPVAE